jgi:isopenicillin-N N-acyltransferase-like protein
MQWDSDLKGFLADRATPIFETPNRGCGLTTFGAVVSRPTIPLVETCFRRTDHEACQISVGKRREPSGETMIRTFVSRPASPRVRGEEFGEAHATQIAGALERYRELFARLGGASLDLQQLGDEVMSTTTAFSNDCADEITGIAAGAGLPVWSVAVLNARTEILARCRRTGRGECSTIVAVGEADVPMIAVQTWDWHEELSDYWLVWTIEHADGSVVHTLTEFGILAKIGVNSRGLGVMMNLLHHEKDGTGIGVPVHILARRILEGANDLNQSLNLVATSSASASAALTVLAAQGADKVALSVEIYPGGPGYILPDDRGILIHTNHFVSAPGAWGDRENVIGPDSFFRYEILRRRLREVEPASAADLIAALVSHFGGGGAICCHPDADAEFGTRYATLATVTLDVKAGHMTVQEGGPCHAGSDRWESREA